MSLPLLIIERKQLNSKGLTSRSVWIFSLQAGEVFFWALGGMFSLGPHWGGTQRDSSVNVPTIWVVSLRRLHQGHQGPQKVPKDIGYSRYSGVEMGERPNLSREFIFYGFSIPDPECMGFIFVPLESFLKNIKMCFFLKICLYLGQKTSWLLSIVHYYAMRNFNASFFSDHSSTQ